MIPLWPFSNAANVHRLVCELCPGWRSLEIAPRGKYLGFVVGPNTSADGWAKPLAKFKQRVTHWSNMRLGIALNIIVFNIFIVPVLEYVAQILNVEDKVQHAMVMAMRRLAAGPGNWIKLQDLENLIEYGFPAEMRTIGTTSKAAKLRLVSTVASDAMRKCSELQVAQSESLGRPFGAWHQKSFYQVLNNNRIELQRLGITPESVLSKARPCKGGTPTKDQFQTLARRDITRTTAPYNEEFRIRRKMQRWRLDGPEAVVAARILRNCKTISKMCRPCVLSIFFRTFWNGWPTSRRMRTAPGATGVLSCLLGCELGEDSIEHYLLCPAAWQVLAKHRGIQLDPSRRNRQAMLLAMKGLSDNEVKAIAISIYAIARTVQALRGSSGCEAAPLMKLYLEEGRKRS